MCTYTARVMNIVVLRLCRQCGRPANERARERDERKEENRREHSDRARISFLFILSFFVSSTYARVFSFCTTIDRHRHSNETTDFMKEENSSFQSLINYFEPNLSSTMGANDSPTTTRSIITDYFDWRLNNKTITNNRLFLIVRKIACDCEAAYRSQQSTFNSHFSSSSPMDSQSLNNIRDIHHEIAREMFNDGTVSWSRIVTLISFSALLAEHIIQQQSNTMSNNLIITSIIDWTTNFIDNELDTWLQSQNYWVRRNVCFFTHRISFMFLCSLVV